MSSTLSRLARVLEDRKSAPARTSYVASLYAGGLERIVEKIGEEAGELSVAAKSKDRRAIVHETADLWFHTLVLLAERGLKPEDVLAELERRFGRSGLEEKASRARLGE